MSCPTDGTCAAIGIYDAAGVRTGTTPVAIQEPLLDYLSDSLWTTSEGALPSGLEPGRSSNKFGVCARQPRRAWLSATVRTYDGESGGDQPGGGRPWSTF